MKYYLLALLLIVFIGCTKRIDVRDSYAQEVYRIDRDFQDAYTKALEFATTKQMDSVYYYQGVMKALNMETKYFKAKYENYK